MTNIITTVVGDFKVHLRYQPSADDMILNRFIGVINRFAMQPIVVVAEEHPELVTINDSEKLADLAISLMESDEAKIEKALYDTTRAGSGAGRRLTLSLSKRDIDLSNF